jgi:hypothetical protein
MFLIYLEISMIIYWIQWLCFLMKNIENKIIKLNEYLNFIKEL